MALYRRYHFTNHLSQNTQQQHTNELDKTSNITTQQQTLEEHQSILQTYVDANGVRTYGHTNTKTVM